MVGDRIRLINMPDDPNPLPIGSEGVILFEHPIMAGRFVQYRVRWDNGRTLMLCCPPDSFITIQRIGYSDE